MISRPYKAYAIDFSSQKPVKTLLGDGYITESAMWAGFAMFGILTVVFLLNR